MPTRILKTLETGDEHAFGERADGSARALALLRVADLFALLRGEEKGGYRVEHVFDY